MAISLGRTLSSPSYVLIQIANGAALFFMCLGLAQVLVTQLVQAKLTPAAAEQNEVASLTFLFDSRLSACIRGGDNQTVTTVVHSSPGTFFIQHLVAVLLCAYPLSLLLVRRKFVYDFVMTIYALYFVITNIVMRRAWGGGLVWWLTVCVSGAALSLLTSWICKKRELQDIVFAPSQVRATATTTGSPDFSHTEEEMWESRPGSTTPPPSASASGYSAEVKVFSTPGIAKKTF